MAYEGVVGTGAVGGGASSLCGIAIITVIILLLIAMGILF